MRRADDRLLPTEVVEYGRRRLRVDDRAELFARCPPHAREAPERRQQRATPPRPDAGHVIEI